jgi:hypothetical protein
MPAAATNLTTPTEIGQRRHGTAGGDDEDGEETRTPALGRKSD